MDLLFEYRQEKIDKKYDATNVCHLYLHKENDNILFSSYFDFDYSRYGVKKHVSFIHKFNFDLNTGDVVVTYNLINDNLTEDRLFRNSSREKKNDFKMLFELTENGFDRGEKRIGYWGIKYVRATGQMKDILYSQIKDKFKSPFVQQKLIKGEYTINCLYDMLVDLHLEIKGIKGHNGIYNDIQNEYPKKRWLEKNDYKFLPAVLDSYGIKSKYLIGELSKDWNKTVNVSSLNYICKLFGNNHIDYLKQINWSQHCYDIPPNKKLHELKNDSEKKYMVSVINKWEKDSLKTDSLIYMINKLLSIRELLEARGLDLKFKAKNDYEFDNTLEMWYGFKLHFARGYKVRYILPDEFIKEIEEDITIDEMKFKPKLILTEEDFRIEGYNMKNCMSKQFPHGAVYIFVSLQHKRKKINLQYRKGSLVQSYGKANTPTPTLFEPAMNILTDRFKKYTTLEWRKEKYDFLTNSLSTS
jgi:hypothetical protein